MGLLIPGETTLIAASVYAGTTHHINIFWVVAAAALGAIIGDNIGYFIGLKGGFPLLLKFGKYLHIDEGKMKVGQYLFARHGGKIVFFGRFVSFLRAWAAFFAGVNKMEWKRFLLVNAAGGIFWSAYYGTLGFWFGKTLPGLSRPLRLIFFIVGMIILVASFLYIRFHMRSLEKKAEKAIPGKLK